MPEASWSCRSIWVFPTIEGTPSIPGSGKENRKPPYWVGEGGGEEGEGGGRGGEGRGGEGSGGGRGGERGGGGGGGGRDFVVP